MSRNNCMVDRGEMIALLDQLRAELPAELRRAAALLEERDKIIDAGKREADRIISEGEAEHARLVSVNEIMVSAEHEGARIIAEARAEAQRLREEVDDYVDTALANFEQFLTRALASIERGRDKMHALREIGTFQGRGGRAPAALLSGPATDGGPGSTVDDPRRSGNLFRRPSPGRSLDDAQSPHDTPRSRSPLVLDTRDLPRRPGASACGQAGGAGAGGPRPGADRRAGGRRPRPRPEAGVGVRGRARLRHRPRPAAGRVRALPARDQRLVGRTIQELYAYENSTTDETTDEDEVGRMQGDLIDLEPALRDAVVLTLPTNPLCRADCPGLCPECGVHWDELPADHSHEQVDPRWAALSQTRHRTEE